MLLVLLPRMVAIGSAMDGASTSSSLCAFVVTPVLVKLEVGQRATIDHTSRLHAPSRAPSHCPKGRGSSGEDSLDTAADFEPGPPIQTIGPVRLSTDSADERGAVHRTVSAEEKLAVHSSAAGPPPTVGVAGAEKVSVTVAMCVVFGCQVASGGHLSLREALTVPSLDAAKSSKEPGISVHPSIVEEADTLKATVPPFTVPPSLASFPSLRQPKNVGVPTLVPPPGHASRSSVGSSAAATPPAAMPHTAASDTACICDTAPVREREERAPERERPRVAKGAASDRSASASPVHALDLPRSAARPPAPVWAQGANEFRNPLVDVVLHQQTKRGGETHERDSP